MSENSSDDDQSRSGEKSLPPSSTFGGAFGAATAASSAFGSKSSFGGSFASSSGGGVAFGGTPQSSFGGAFGSSSSSFGGPSSSSTNVSSTSSGFGSSVAAPTGEMSALAGNPASLGISGSSDVPSSGFGGPSSSTTADSSATTAPSTYRGFGGFGVPTGDMSVFRTKTPSDAPSSSFGGSSAAAPSTSSGFGGSLFAAPTGGLFGPQKPSSGFGASDPSTAPSSGFGGPSSSTTAAPSTSSGFGGLFTASTGGSSLFGPSSGGPSSSATAAPSNAKRPSPLFDANTTGSSFGAGVILDGTTLGAAPQGAPYFKRITNDSTLAWNFTPFAERLPSSGRLVTVHLQSMSNKGNCIDFSVEQLRYINQTTPALFPDPTRQYISPPVIEDLSKHKHVQDLFQIDVNKSVMHPNGFTFINPPPFHYSPAPLAIPTEADFTPFDEVKLPESFADIHITNIHSGHEFALHTPMLSVYGIGSHHFAGPSHPLFRDPVGMLSKRLQMLRTFLETSTLPIYLLKNAIAHIYRLDMPTILETPDKTLQRPTSFDLSQCHDRFLEVLLIEEMGLFIVPFINYWCDTYLNQASPEEAVAILHRIFFTSSIESINSILPTDANKVPPTAYTHLISVVLEVVRKSKGSFMETIASLETTDHAIGLVKAMLLASIVCSKSSVALIDQAAMTPFRRFILDWSSVDPTSDDEAPAPDAPVDMQAAGEEFVECQGLYPSEFAIGIEGNGPSFIAAQGTKMFWHWEYFRRLVVANMTELKTRVIILPSHFPVALLEVIMRLIHGYDPLHVLLHELSRTDLEFVISSGAEFGLLRSNVETPTPHPLFFSLYRAASSKMLVPLSTTNCLEQLQAAHELGLVSEVNDALSFAVQFWDTVADQCRKQLKLLDPTLLKELINRIAVTEPTPRHSPAPRFGTTPAAAAPVAVAAPYTSDTANVSRRIRRPITVTLAHEDLADEGTPFLDVFLPAGTPMDGLFSHFQPFAPFEVVFFNPEGKGRLKFPSNDAATNALAMDQSLLGSTPVRVQHYWELRP